MGLLLPLADALRERWNRFVATIAERLPPDAAAPSAPQLDTATLRRMMAHLAESLDKDSFQSNTLYRELREPLAATLGDDAQRLEQYIEHFDYPRALEILQRLLRDTGGA